MTTNFEPHECVNYVQTTKIGTHENKANYSIEKWSLVTDFQGEVLSNVDGKTQPNLF